MTSAPPQSTVLLAVADTPLANALRSALEPDGYTIHAASTGEAALLWLAAESIDVLICDQQLADMTGTELLVAAARQTPETARLRLCTADDLSAATTANQEAEVASLLPTPWQEEHLRETVREAARAAVLRRELGRLRQVVDEQQTELERWAQRFEHEVAERTADFESRNYELQTLQYRLQQSLDDTVALLAGVLEASNPNAALHSKRVARLARQLGEQLKLDPEALGYLDYAAQLHDIGKISRLPAARPGRGRPLGEHRTELDHRRAESGYAMLMRVRGFGNVANAVLHQYENYDGTGFPENRKGDAIPLASRIIAIVNAFDEAAHAHNSTRTDSARGCRELLEGRGKRFDPTLVTLFIQGVEAFMSERREEDEMEVAPADLTSGMVLSRDMRNADGVLVLKRGTRLSQEHIVRIRLMGDMDPLLNSVYIRCTAEAAAARKPAPKADAMAAAPSTLLARHGAPGKRALIVDDDVLVCNALARELRRAGWTVSCAENGREAQNILEENQFDLLLVDVAMPLMTGDLLVAHVQQCWPDIPCIVLTGHASREQLVRLSQAKNVVEILAKPWDHDRLQTAIVTATSAAKGDADGGNGQAGSTT